MRVVAVFFLCISAVSAFVPPSSRASNIALRESFGFDFATDQVESTPEQLLGEANYKTWVGEINENAFLNRKYNVLRRVRELELLQKTLDYGILEKLDDLGVDLKLLEGSLPLVENLGLLGAAGRNQQLIINLVSFFLVEGAPFLIPLIAPALGAGPIGFIAPGLALGAAEVALIETNAELPFVGLPAGVFLGLLLVPLSVILTGLGVGLSTLKK
mmetsp:Transcript_20046/g.30474  ORF Transcript_20046/g.30474 Transcript_20046/m.30474 type:complete len:215 (-) Transcript_20046:173-817(-)